MFLRNLSRGHQNTCKILKRIKQTDTNINKSVNSIISCNTAKMSKCTRIVHGRPLYLVFPDLLRAVSETSYGIRVEFIGSDVVFAICFFVCLYLIRKVYSYPVKQTKHHILTTENSPSFPPQITPLFSLTTLSTASLVEAS